MTSYRVPSDQEDLDPLRQPSEREPSRRRHLHGILEQEGMVELIARLAEEAEFEALNEFTANPRALPRSRGEHATRLLGEKLGHELAITWGFTQESVPGGQHRFVSPDGLFCPPIAFVPFRGRWQDALVRVNEKGKRTRDLTRTNSLKYGLQVEIVDLAESYDEKPYMTVFIVTEPKGVEVRIHLVVSMEMSGSGHYLGRNEDRLLIKTINCDAGPVNLPSPTVEPIPNDVDDFDIEDRNVATG